jgi:hypothetical protein
MMETSPKLKEGDERAVEIPPDAKSITSRAVMTSIASYPFSQDSPTESSCLT